jgi:putative membrane protein
MYRKLLVAGAACAALALAACGQKVDDADMNAQATPDANPAVTELTPADEASAPVFVNKAAAGDMFEIQSSQLALTRSTNKDVRDFAQMMVDAHTGTSTALKGAIADSGQTLTLPTMLPMDMQDKLDSLGKASDADFDRAYLDAQIDAHQSALNLLTRYASDGDIPALKAFAGETAPKVQDHLTKAKALRDGLK